MRLEIFHLQATAPFHFGMRGVGIEESADHAPSDTVFSALCNVLRLVDSNQALEDLLDTFRKGLPPFLCSGAFPYVTAGDEIIRFYPAPISLHMSSEKSVRRITWLSEKLFLGWVSAVADDAYLTENVTQLHDKHVLVTLEEGDVLSSLYRHPEGEIVLWDVDEVPRVAIDRVTNASNVFQAGRLRFPEGCGLWCGFSALEQGSLDTEWLYDLLVHLGHAGLGGERSAGHGRFDVNWPPAIVDLPDPSANGQFVTLSHYHPEIAEIEALTGNAAYDLILRRGWMNSPDGNSLRHKSVRMVSSGSVLRATKPAGSYYGELVDVTPDLFRKQGGHTVWRYGFALPIGLQRVSGG